MKMKSLVDAVPALRKLSGQDMAVGDLHALHMLIEKATPHLNFYDEKRGILYQNTAPMRVERQHRSRNAYPHLRRK